MGVRRTSLIVLPLLAALAVFLVVDANGGAGNANAQDTPTLSLDMDITNGDGPCNPVDPTRATSGDEAKYEVAICLADFGAPPAAFQFDLLYDDTLDQCLPTECPDSNCLDGNPDSNAGATVFSSPSLGGGWDCNVLEVEPAVCDNDPGSGAGHGKAHLSCLTPGDPTLPVGTGVSAPLAVVTFKTLAAGSDEFTLGDAALYTKTAQNLYCPGTQCFGGTSEDNLSPTSPTPALEGTPAAGTTPGAETTPGGEVATPDPGVATAAAATAVAQGTPIAAINQAATATSAAVATKAASSSKTPTGKATAKPGQTSDTSGGGSSGPNAFLIAGIVAGCVIVAGGAGWFGYRRFRATR